MRKISPRVASPVLLAIFTLSASGGVSAQDQDATESTITVTGEAMPAFSEMTVGPEIKGNITARSGNQIQVITADGTSSVFSVSDSTQIKASKGIFSSNKLATDSLLNGLPITVKTLQWSGGLVASQIKLRNTDLKTASMIRNGTAQGFAEQTAATQALRGRMGDIDKYNIKGTTNVYFDTGKWLLSPQAKSELCVTATNADATDNALMLVVGYTDSVGDDDFNQTLSEKRASTVINHLQQACRWKPYRMLTPTGMAESDPLASNDTEEGKAQNRRVSVNVLVSKSVDGL